MTTKADEKPKTEEKEPEAEPAKATPEDEKDEQAVFRLMQRLDGKPYQLHAKIADVMQIAERIPKRGTAPTAMGGFSFVQVGDAADFIRKALGRRGVSMVPSKVEILRQSEHATKSGGVMTTLELLQTWTLTDSVTNEQATIMSYGAGSDTGDKFSGKAMTSGMKYALLTGFMLSTGEDSELSDASDKSASGEVKAPNVSRGRGRAPAAGGRQQDQQTVPQKQMIGNLLRQAGVRTTAASVELLEKLTGQKIELTGDDPNAAFSAWVDGLDPNVSGKLVHDLRKHVETLQKDREHEQGGAEPNGGESSPGAPAGAAPDESLEAGDAL